MDFIMIYRLIRCLNLGLPLDINVYDSVMWSAITPLSELSANTNSQSIKIPDFTSGKRKINSPLEYTAIKAGIIAITKYLAKYYKKKNIRINCVSPGGIEDQQPKIFKKRYQKSCNSKGLLNEMDVVNLLLYLISDKSKYVTGQNLVIDDGWSL